MSRENSDSKKKPLKKKKLITAAENQ